jgi:Putative sensor
VPGLPSAAVRLREGRTWREFGYFALAPVTALVPAAVVAFLAVTVAHNLAYPVTEWGVDLNDAWGGPTWIGAVALHVGAGVAFLALSPPVVRVLARCHAALVRRLLTAG